MIINKEIKNYLLNYKLLIDFQIILNMREISFFLITNIGIQFIFILKMIK